MNLIPCNDNVLIKKKIESSSIGLVLPEQIDYCEGEVVAVGPGAINLKTGEHIVMGVSIGQHVLVKDYMIEKLKGVYKDYIMVPMTHILAIIDNNG